ncbi:MAG: tetratricopeptide repeat protein [Marinoscillum sp.]|uniref:tetratricopeptide repeat protein n=1 Tax=Marinoscillum sp. TaxID=2024838 RepID=UPI0032F8607F
MKLLCKVVIVVSLCALSTYFSWAGVSQNAFSGLDMARDSLRIAGVIVKVESGLKAGTLSADSASSFFHHLAKQYQLTHDFQQARTHIKKSLELLDDLENKELVAANHLLLGDMAMEEDDNAIALELLSAALKIYENLGDSVNYLLTLRKIGVNYDYINDHPTALQYYEECIELAQKLGRQDVVGACYNTIGSIYCIEGEEKKGIQMYEKAVRIAQETNDRVLLHKLYHNMALTYKDLELFGEASAFLNKTLVIAAELEDPKWFGFSYQAMGHYYYAYGKLDSAEYFMKKALGIAEKINNAQLRVNAWEVLEQVYSRTGRYKEAYDVFKLIKVEDDSIFNLQNTQLIESIKAKYQAEKHDRELAEKNLQLQEAGYNMDRQQNMQTALVVVVALLVIILFLIYRGYTLRKKANDMLRLKNSEIESHMAQVETLNQTKSRWFVNVAHELRTPLTLIKGPVNRVIAEYDLPDEVRQDLMMVEKNANSLANLVNEILDLSRLEEGEISLNESTFGLCEQVSMIVSSFTSRAEQLGVALHNRCPMDVYIKADKEKINKLMVNLISNALKFTPRGGAVEVLVHADKGLEILVKDTGSGISPKDLPYVFDRFFQSTDPEHQMQGGTGIGLALSKEIAEMHGGELKVSSQLGVGSVFTLSLPAHMITTAVEEEVDSSEDTSQVGAAEALLSLDNRPSLLLVEDNKDMSSYVASLLVPHFEVVEVASAEEGLQVLRTQNIRFIVSDVMMSGMDGFAFLREVKADPLWRHLPFIHLSALADDNLRKEALRIGIDDFLTKPFDPEELIIRVKNLYDNFLSRISINVQSDEDSYDERIMKRLKKEVLTNIEDANFNVLRLADGAAMSERQLYRYLKGATGLTPLQFIQEIKLTKAIELARKKVYSSTNELASAVGFRQASYFSTLFERRYGKKPGTFLKS